MATVMTHFISHLPTHYRLMLVSLMLLHWCDEENRLKTYKTLGLKTNPTSETHMSRTGLFIHFVILLRVDKPYMATMVYRGIFLIYHSWLSANFDNNCSFLNAVFLRLIPLGYYYFHSLNPSYMYPCK